MMEEDVRPLLYVIASLGVLGTLSPRGLFAACAVVSIILLIKEGLQL